MKLLTVKQVADRTGWAAVTIYQKSSKGELPGKVKLGSSLRFQEAAIENFLRKLARASGRPLMKG